MSWSWLVFVCSESVRCVVVQSMGWSLRGWRTTFCSCIIAEPSVRQGSRNEFVGNFDFVYYYWRLLSLPTRPVNTATPQSTHNLRYRLPLNRSKLEGLIQLVEAGLSVSVCHIYQSGEQHKVAAITPYSPPYSTPWLSITSTPLRTLVETSVVERDDHL